MNQNKTRPYLLAHITPEETSKKIKKTNGFKISVHDVKNAKNEWLGDGVYFWDGNDEKALDFGKKVISNKPGFKNKKLVAIFTNIEILQKNHINLEIAKERNDFYNFIKVNNPEEGEITINVMEMLRKREYINKRDLATVGKFLGKYINSYLDYLLRNFGEDIKMVSCYFFHKKNELYTFARGEMIIRQFCIKDVEIVNNNINEWKIVKI